VTGRPGASETAGHAGGGAAGRQPGVGRFADLAEAIAGAPARLGPVRAVAVDGPAGSGKTTFAARLATALRDRSTTVAEVHVDDLLEGWDGLAGFWPRLESGVLAPLRRGEPGRYRPYDWARHEFADASRPVPVPDVLLVEGVGSGRLESRPDLTLLVWVEAPEPLRLSRGVARDGPAVRDEWVRWMASERAHFAENDTRTHADLRVDGASSVPHDPLREFVGVISGWTRLTR
jgi:uridine kinase